jgi:hypothetical protein
MPASLIRRTWWTDPYVYPTCVDYARRLHPERVETQSQGFEQVDSSTTFGLLMTKKPAKAFTLNFKPCYSSSGLGPASIPLTLA